MTARDLIARLQSLGPGWRKVEEEMPPQFERVLVRFGETCVIACLDQLHGDDWFRPDIGVSVPDVTHWMPLPKGPENNET